MADQVNCYSSMMPDHFYKNGKQPLVLGNIVVNNMGSSNFTDMQKKNIKNEGKQMLKKYTAAEKMLERLEKRKAAQKK